MLAVAWFACVSVSSNADAPDRAAPLALRLSDTADAAKPDYVKAAATTPEGDVAIALLFSGPISIDRQGTVMPGSGIDTGVIVYDHRTGQLRTRFSFGGDAPRVVPHGLAVDADGSFVIVGYAGGDGASTVDLGGGPRPFSAAEAPFVARFDRAGHHLWSHVLHGREGSRPQGCAGRNCDRAWDVALTAEGRVVVVGGFSGTLALPRGELVAAGDSDLFVLVLTRDGQQSAAWRIGGPGPEAGRQGFAASPGGLGEMAVALAGERVVVQGTFGPDTDFGGTGTRRQLSPANGVRDVFVARYTQEGALEGDVWVAGATRDVAGGMAAPGAMSVDRDGTLYLSLRLPPGINPWLGCAASAGPAERTLTLSLDAELRCRWVTPWDFTGGGIHRTQIDGQRHVYVAGWFAGGHAFPNQRVSARSTRTDVFAARLDARTGAVAWGAALVATQPVAAGNIPAALAIDGGGMPWMGGQFFCAVELAQPGQPSVVLKPAFSGAISARSADGFLVRFDAATGALK